MKFGHHPRLPHLLVLSLQLTTLFPRLRYLQLISLPPSKSLLEKQELSLPIIPAFKKLRQEDFHEFESYHDYKVRPISENPKPWLCKVNTSAVTKRTYVPDIDQAPSLYPVLSKHWEIRNGKFSELTASQTNMSRPRFMVEGWELSVRTEARTGQRENVLLGELCFRQTAHAMFPCLSTRMLWRPGPHSLHSSLPLS